MWAINGLPWTGAIAAKPKVGTTELWVLENTSGGWFHPVHIHLVDFHIVRRNGKKPPAWEQGWKDVVYVGPNETVELVMRFNAGQADGPDTVPVDEAQAGHRQVRHALPQPGPRGPRHDDAVPDPARLLGRRRARAGRDAGRRGRDSRAAGTAMAPDMDGPA